MQEFVIVEGISPEARVRVEQTFAALKLRGVEPTYVKGRTEALTTILGMVPKGSAVAHGTSTTLIEIGLVDRMKAPDSGYRYLNSEWTAENDAAKRGRLRAKLSMEADDYLGSAQAICETGEVIGSDMSGNRQAFYAYGPAHVIWVAGMNKLVPALEDALRRVREVALPLEDKRVRATGGAGSYVGKLVIYERERPGRIALVLVGEKLGS
ncbi:MAG: lactate utilization protein [Candidatus Thermoplasmatota archaeon]